jgi:Leucine-rich repeat (LRR) protein
VSSNSPRPKSSFKYDLPNQAYEAARRQINNALRSNQASLDLSNLGLTDLPPEIGELRSLRELNISKNQLVNLPTEIGQLTALQQFNASVHQLRDSKERASYYWKAVHLDQR